MAFGGIITFAAGVAVGASAMAPLVGYALTGWRKARARLAKQEPAAKLGREYRARCDRWNAKRRGE